LHRGALKGARPVEKGLGKGAKKLNSFSLEDAKKLIDEYYEDAKKKKYIRRPLAWAMYKAWRKVSEYKEKVE
jgi:hypothetical protein